MPGIDASIFLIPSLSPDSNIATSASASCCLAACWGDTVIGSASLAQWTRVPRRIVAWAWAWGLCVKLLSGGRYGDPFLATTLPPLSTRYGQRDNLIRRSRERYTAPRSVVEERIRRWLGSSAALGHK